MLDENARLKKDEIIQLMHNALTGSARQPINQYLTRYMCGCTKSFSSSSRIFCRVLVALSFDIL